MIKITVLRSLGSRIGDQVLRHAADFGVLSFDPQEPQLSSVIVYSDELSFVVPPSHPLAGSKEISIRQLGAETFVAHNVPSPYRDKVIDSFRKYKTPLHMDVELPTLQAIKRFVAMGNGVAFVPHISAETEIATGELVRIPVRELDLNRKMLSSGAEITGSSEDRTNASEPWAGLLLRLSLGHVDRLGLRIECAADLDPLTGKSPRFRLVVQVVDLFPSCQDKLSPHLFGAVGSTLR
jgi:DNA-binding transcriptional LysR family regulator